MLVIATAVAMIWAMLEQIGLGGQESQAQFQHDQMHHQADGADNGEEDKARIHHIARHLGQQQAQEFDADLGIEFGFAVKAFAECIRLFGDAQALARRGGDVEQDLEARPATGAARWRRAGRAAS